VTTTPPEVMRNHTQGVRMQRALELRLVEVEGRWIDVAEDGAQSRFEYRRRHGKARVGRDDDLGPPRHRLERRQRDRQSSRS
jgi:hypothetical protein